MTEPRAAKTHAAKPNATSRRLTQKQEYNVVTDTVVGPNVRLKDNLLQALFIGFCIALGAGIGALFVEPPIAGALVGGFVGMVLGLLCSGIFLMVYRGIRHIRGRHD